ncbi:hypothetical protein [Pseudomonas sp. PDM31]|uniref:hypothetical protein n=1 Tax=Pseudomonas sp. PDM31 TaxID=2854778 RepID=UPI001C452CE6|nr:hypothetical protein [Pseudomonas sp. PDM31]MBV7480304.1 hypothetical protein [Pseudomonas sp. PDM31]
MKPASLAGLLTTCAILASPVSAADNTLCTSKLQELNNKVTALPATSTNTTMEIKRLLSSAQASQAAGDDTKCVTEASQAMALADQQTNAATP